MATGGDDGLVTVAEAAQRLGIGRLRVREALAAGLLDGVRDNHGHWRVRIGAAEGAAVERRLAAARPAPEVLVRVLFDEVEELQDDLAERDATIAALAALLERQQALTERAVAIAESQPAADAARQAGERAITIADRALRQAEVEQARAARLGGLVERSLSAGERMEKAAEADRAALERQAAVAERQRGMIETLLSVAERTLAAAGERGRGTTRGLIDRLFGRGGSGPG